MTMNIELRIKCYMTIYTIDESISHDDYLKQGKQNLLM